MTYSASRAAAQTGIEPWKTSTIHHSKEEEVSTEIIEHRCIFAWKYVLGQPTGFS
jgi:hypothetical protein